MKGETTVGKRDFIQQTSKYLKLAQAKGELTITHHNHPVMKLVPLQEKTIDDLRGIAGKVKVHGDVNTPVLPGLDEWSS